MTTRGSDPAHLEAQIAQWRDYLARRHTTDSTGAEELEAYLRGQIDSLRAAGLDSDEAFLVAVRRLGNTDEVSREFVREHSDRLWKQTILPGDGTSGTPGHEALVVICLALAAAAAIKLPALFGYPMSEEESYNLFFPRNFSLFVLPFLTGYFVWKRDLRGPTRAWLIAPFVAGALFANVYPFAPNAHTLLLTILHLPIALWLAVGVAHAAGHWNTVGGRMNFVRFSGELAIYFDLFALGGGVLTAFTLAIFRTIGLEIGEIAVFWILPCGAVGAIIIGAWLVEAKQSVVENMAPVLARVFTPLFVLVLLAFLATVLVTGRGIDVERNVLIAFDLLLVVVVGLVLYTVSSRDRDAAPGVFDFLQLVLIVCALLVDLFALTAIVSRITEFGFSPNKVAALAENLILLANLAGAAWLYAGFMRGRTRYVALERWQTSFLPIYSGWAAFVVIAFPPLFAYR